MKIKYEDEVLDNIDLSNKCLIGITFIRCNIRFAKFDNSDLSYASFDSCDLYCSSFKGAVFYTTKLMGCDTTKADFRCAFLNGVRVKDVVVVQTNFGFDFNTGLERKSVHDTSSLTDLYLRCSLYQVIGKSISNLEETYDGIFCTTTNRAIRFIKPQNGEDHLRVWKRKAEIAKSIKEILDSNGYGDLSVDYYYFHRKFLRKSYDSNFYRFGDWLFGEFLWGYGVKIWHPIRAFFLICFAFTAIYSVLPFVDGYSGIYVSDKLLKIFDVNNGIQFIDLFKIMYSALLISSLSVFGGVDAVGYAKLFAGIHTIFAILILGLGIASVTKKMSNL